MLWLVSRPWRYVSSRLARQPLDPPDAHTLVDLTITETLAEHEVLSAAALVAVTVQQHESMRLNGKLAAAERMDHHARREARASIFELVERAIDATREVDRIRNQLEQDTAALRERLIEATSRLDQLAQVERSAELTEVMQTLSSTVGDDVPTAEVLEHRIRTRLNALGLDDWLEAGS